MTEDEALTLKALKYAASLGNGRIVREMNIAPFVIRSDKALAQPESDPWREAVAQPEERNFCSRCGKRTADLTSIHTCTPPQ